MEYLKAIALGAGGGLFVRLFFVSVRSEWPASYELVATPAQREQRRSLPKYLLIRGGPVFLTSVFVLNVAVGLDISLWLCLWALVFVELLGSSLRGLVSMPFIRGISTGRRVELVLYYVASGLLVVIAGLLAVLLRRPFAAVIPDPRELPAALWTGVFAAVVAISLRRFTGSSTDPQRDVEAGARDLGPALLAYARGASTKADCDGDLIESILIAECVQRPRWFRGLERAKGHFVKAGTYGVAQVSAPAPLSDEQSIDELCSRFSGYYPLRNHQGGLRRAALQARLEMHNPSCDFIDTVVSILEQRVGYFMYKSATSAQDQRPEITVDSFERVAQAQRMSGTALSAATELVLSYHSQGGATSTTTVRLSAASAQRQQWTAQVPVGATSLTVAPSDALGQADRIVTVDMSYF